MTVQLYSVLLISLPEYLQKKKKKARNGTLVLDVVGVCKCELERWRMGKKRGIFEVQYVATGVRH